MTPTEARRLQAAELGAKCSKCPGRDASGCVLPNQVENPELIVVTGKPSESDIKSDTLLSGSSGRLLGREMDRLHVDHATTLVSSAILCNVPKSDIAKARKCCLPRLQRELDKHPQTSILCLGGLATQSALGLGREPNIEDWRGSVIKSRPDEESNTIDRTSPNMQSGSLQPVPSSGRLLFPNLSPKQVDMQPEWGWVWHRDLERAIRLRNSDWFPPEETSGHITQIVTFRFTNVLDTLAAGPIALDIETTGLDTQSCEVLCIGLSDGQNSLVFPWREMTSEVQSDCCSAFNSFFRFRTAITHNGPAFDLVILRRLGFEIPHWVDTLNASHVLHSHMRRKLGHVATIYLDVPPWKRADHESQDALYKYNAADCLYTRMLWDKLENELGTHRLQSVYKCDLATGVLCSRMQSVGFAFDRERAQILSASMREREVALIQRASDLTGHPINLLSPSDLSKAFFFDLKAPVFFRTKSGKAQLNAEALRGYTAHSNPEIAELAQIVLDFRAAHKTRVTYVDNITIAADGRVHPSWRNYGAVTGRWACSNPNLANLSKPQNDPSAKAGLGGIRSLYVAKPGYKLIGFDAKQLEMRLAAYLSGDEAMIAACESTDLHTSNAKLIWPDFNSRSAYAQKELRDLAKTAGFAVVYGASARTVHSRIVAMGKSVKLSQVKAMLQRIRKIFPRFFEWQAEYVATTTRYGYCFSPIVGRRKWTGHNPISTEVGNFPIQSGAADFFNTRLPKLMARLDDDDTGSEIVAHVYDAAYIETPEAEAARVAEICREIFEAPLQLGGRMVVLPIDIKSGYRWSDV